MTAEPHAQTHRHRIHPDHRRRPDRHRPGLRVRLLRRAGLQGAEGRGLPRHPGELQSRHHHDRPGPRRRHLCRADHPRDRRTHHRPREARRTAADHGRPDRAQHRDAARALRRAETPRRRADRRAGRGDRPRRGPAEVPRRDGRDRHRIAALRHRALAGGSARSARHHRPARGDPAHLHVGRHRRRHRLQPRGVRADRRRRPRSLSHHRGADRRIRARLEGIRDGGGPRPRGQLHHRLLDRERRSDGHPHRRFRHRRPRADADRQGISADARRLDRLPAHDRRRHRRLQRAVRGEPGRWPHGHHRDEPARVAFLGAGIEGHRLPDRQDRGQARRRLHAGRTCQRHHPRHAGQLRADHRLRRGEDPALHLREIPRHAGPADHVDEVGRRGDGDRPQLRRSPAEGPAQHGDRPVRSRRDRAARRRRPRRLPRGAVRAATRPPADRRPGVACRPVGRGHPRRLQVRPVVPARTGTHRRRRTRDRRIRPAARGRRAAPPQGARLLRPASGAARRLRRGRGRRPARAARCASGLQAYRHLRRRVRLRHALHVLDLRGRLWHPGLRGRSHRPAQDRHPRRRTQPHRPGHRVRLLLRPRGLRTEGRRLRDHHGQLQSGNRQHRLRHLGPAVFRAADRRGRHRPCPPRGEPRHPAGLHRAVRRPDSAEAVAGAGTREDPHPRHHPPMRSTSPRTASASSACCTASACASRRTASRARPRRPRRSPTASAIRW